MKARRFNSIMPWINEFWAAEVLGLQKNPGKGPDLIGNHFNMELKFTLIDDGNNAYTYPQQWTVLEHQIDYINGKKIYWGFGTYKLAVPIINITDENLSVLEELVIERELSIVPWNFIRKYEPHFTFGRTAISQWENVLRYPKMRDLPPVVKTISVKKGKLHIRKGVNVKHFEGIEIPF